MKKILFTILIILSLNLSFATFTINGNTITQTGTDTDLSGLSPISEVTITNKNSHTQYHLEDLKLRIEGTLTIAKDNTREQLRISDSDGSYTFNNIEIANGGTLIIGTKKSNSNNYDYQNYIPAIQEDIGSVGYSVRNGHGGSGAGSGTRFATLVVLNGGQFEIYGRVVNVGAWGTQATSTTIWDGAYITKDSASYGYANDMTITNSIYKSFSLVASSAYTQLSNNKIIGTPFALSGATPNDIRITINGIKDLGGTQLVNVGKGGVGVNALNSPIAEAVNLEKGTDQTYQVLSNRYWRTELKSEVEIEVKDLNGNLVSDAKIYYKGKDGTQNIIATNNLGIANFTFLMAKRSAENGTINNYEFFTKNEDTSDDLIDLYVFSYDKNILQIPDYSLRGADVNKIASFLIDDNFISEKNKSIVQNYEGIDINHSSKTITVSKQISLKNLYDYVKLDKLNNLESPSINQLPLFVEGGLKSRYEIIKENEVVFQGDEIFSSLSYDGTILSEGNEQLRVDLTIENNEKLDFKCRVRGEDYSYNKIKDSGNTKLITFDKILVFNNNTILCDAIGYKTIFFKSIGKDIVKINLEKYDNIYGDKISYGNGILDEKELVTFDTQNKQIEIEYDSTKNISFESFFDKIEEIFYEDINFDNQMYLNFFTNYFVIDSKSNIKILGKDGNTKSPFLNLIIKSKNKRNEYKIFNESREILYIDDSKNILEKDEDFNFKIDEFKIFDYNLNDEEIKLLYKNNLVFKDINLTIEDKKEEEIDYSFIISYLSKNSFLKYFVYFN